MIYTKVCVICGKEFQTTTWNKSICSEDHHHPCPVCGKDIVCNDPKRQNCTCSRKCGQQVGNISREQSNLDKYGVTNVSQLDTVKKKISQAQKQLHVKQPIKYKNCEVCGKLFVLQWPYTQHTCSSECRGKYRKLSGVAKSVYQKSSATNIKRYGVANPGERPEIHKKMEDTMEERYGVRYARYIPEIEDRVRKTCLERYGVPYYIQTEDANKDNVYRISKLNKDFAKFLSSSGIEGVELEKYVDGKFYDLFVPPNILIEIDPTYTHNSYGNHWNRFGLDPDYHISKTNIAQINGFRCIHVFDWDKWENIVNLISPKTTIFARNCIVQPLHKDVAVTFTENNHISGSCRGQNICYGLYYNDELVEVMTFGAPRYNHNYDIELLRLCSKKDVRIVGGASKLFKEFLKYNKDVKVISYCDAAKFAGSVYTKIGMSKVSTTQPNKVWSKNDKYITNNLLNQRGYDQLFNTNYGKGTSNESLMLESHWLPVYDCGQYVFEYCN